MRAGGQPEKGVPGASWNFLQALEFLSFTDEQICSFQQHLRGLGSRKHRCCSFSKGFQGPQMV